MKSKVRIDNVSNKSICNNKNKINNKNEKLKNKRISRKKQQLKFQIKEVFDNEKK